MKNRYEQFMDERLPLAGVVACGVRLPDRSQVCRCFTDELSTAQMEQAVSRLTFAADSLNRYRLEANRFCWTFENAYVHLALRPDGTALIILSDSGTGLGATNAATALLEDFSRLPSE